MQLRHQFWGQFDAAGVDFKAPLVNAALPGFKIKVFAGGVQIDDAASAVFQFFKAAESALFAKVVPLIVVLIAHIVAKDRHCRAGCQWLVVAEYGNAADE